MDRSFVIVLALLMTACSSSLGEIRSSDPIQTGTFSKPYEQLAECAQRRIESEAWSFGQPVVQAMIQKEQPLIRVYAIYSRSALFEVTFQPVASGMTLVQYRRGYDGHGTQAQTWEIVESCAKTS